MTDLKDKLEEALNGFEEFGGNTPDFILAELLCDVITAFGKAVRARDQFYGTELLSLRHEASSTPADRPARKHTPRGPSRAKVRDLTSTPASELPARMLMSEVAQIFRVSTRTLRQWVADDTIKSVIQPAGLGGIVLIPKSEVLRLLGEN